MRYIEFNDSIVSKEEIQLNTNLTRIKKISSLLSILIIIIMVALTLAILLQGLSILGLHQNDFGTITMSFGNAELPESIMIEIRDGIDLPLNEMKIDFVVNMLRQILMIGMLFSAYQIFKDFNRSHTPFAPAQTRRLKIIAYLMLALGLIPFAIESTLMHLYAPGTERCPTFEFSNLVYATIFYCLSLIFDYGRVLQQQSDETL